MGFVNNDLFLDLNYYCCFGEMLYTLVHGNGKFYMNYFFNLVFMIQGLEFEFDSKDQVYKLRDIVFDALNLICLVKLFLLYGVVNRRGVVNLNSLLQNLIAYIFAFI